MTLEADALELAAERAGAAGEGEGEARGGGGGELDGRAPAPGRRAEGTTFAEARELLPRALGRAHERLLTALAAVPGGPGTVLPMPYGDVPLGLALHVFVMEAALHRSDLAHAVGGESRLTTGTHAAAAAVLQAFWPALAADAVVAPPPGTAFLLRGTSVRVEAEYDGAAWVSPTGPHAVVISGDDDAVLLAGYGRVPVEAAAVSVEGDVALARRLKEYVPGP
ncbi:hypothetical protein [Georgenia sp. SUBG003]|uniref:hypothetical protein n=1 Tax=Georgenia sp. SUBG003 TaxID=1497974 RepID=UPI0004DADC32|nr:hypothetical protein DA06_08940 [Georgenia sp. SUBG003]